jgi:hypothetical protein
MVAFKRTIRKFLNIVAAHFEGLRHLQICLFVTLFCANFPLSGVLTVYSAVQNVFFFLLHIAVESSAKAPLRYSILYNETINQLFYSV